MGGGIIFFYYNKKIILQTSQGVGGNLSANNTFLHPLNHLINSLYYEVEISSYWSLVYLLLLRSWICFLDNSQNLQIVKVCSLYQPLIIHLIIHTFIITLICNSILKFIYTYIKIYFLKSKRKRLVPFYTQNIPFNTPATTLTVTSSVLIIIQDNNVDCCKMRRGKHVIQKIHVQQHGQVDRYWDYIFLI